MQLSTPVQFIFQNPHRSMNKKLTLDKSGDILKKDWEILWMDGVSGLYSLNVLPIVYLTVVINTTPTVLNYTNALSGWWSTHLYHTRQIIMNVCNFIVTAVAKPNFTVLSTSLLLFHTVVQHQVSTCKAKVRFVQLWHTTNLTICAVTAARQSYVVRQTCHEMKKRSFSSYDAAHHTTLMIFLNIFHLNVKVASHGIDNFQNDFITIKSASWH